MTGSKKAFAGKYLGQYLRFVTLIFAFGANASYGSALGDFGCGGPQRAINRADFNHDDLTAALAFDFAAGDFQSIIMAADIWKERKCLLPDGESQAEYLLSGFSLYFRGAQGWEVSRKQLDKFKSAYPGSAVPYLAEARYWSDYANSARGFGYASTVTSNGWKLFNERLQKSNEILQAIKKEAADWPQWYWQEIRVQALLGEGKDPIDKTFNEGIEKFPNELAIYTERAYYLEPRWGGSWGEADKIALLALGKVRREPSDATYARMYWSRGDLLPVQSALFSESGASWPRMRNGFIELLKKYPTSTRISNAFLSYSCMAGDRNTYLKYRNSFPMLDASGWRDQEDRARCDAAFGFRK